MGHKIFISYKYGDTEVQKLDRVPWWETTKVRHYVDELQEKLTEEDHINKGEADGEDLSAFKDSTIESKLRNKIYDSTVTVVLISPKMKELGTPEDDQWIPWEISYSLRESTRNGRTSQKNGMLAVVLPDTNGNYDYMLERKKCCLSNCTLWHTDKLFAILRRNMFNQFKKTKVNCTKGDNVYNGYPSYIHMIRWDDFIGNINFWIEKAEKIKDNIDDYKVRVEVEEIEE